MNSQTAYVVPKDRQSVTVHFTNGATRQGSIFLEYASPDMTKHQKITAFLESSNAFFPLRLEEQGTTEFLQKNSIRIVEVEYPDSGEPDTALSLMRTIPIIVAFTDGITLSGALMADVPAQKARLSDCLNLPHIFLSMKVQGKILYINKSTLHTVTHDEKAGLS